VIDFDRHAELDAQVRRALSFHGVEAVAHSRFFERELVGQHVDDWRSEVTSREALVLWDALTSRSPT
jgi:hypothetical protein